MTRPLARWRKLHRPRHWALLFEVAAWVAERAYRRVPAYMAGVQSLAEERELEQRKEGARQGAGTLHALHADERARKPVRRNGTEGAND